MDPLRNSKDPLHVASPQAGRELFKMVVQTCVGFAHDQVLDAAMNLIINILRQKNARRENCEREFDELFGRTKGILMNQYDSLGRKKGVYPFDQTIVVGHYNENDRF